MYEQTDTKVALSASIILLCLLCFMVACLLDSRERLQLQNEFQRIEISRLRAENQELQVYIEAGWWKRAADHSD